MIDSAIIKKIEDFVYLKPRSIQEIAQYIGKNWRTADRYIEEIEKEFGTISTRVFRQGTRGALKIVYWSSLEKVSYSIFQENLEKEILRARKKEDFSAFDIFQHVNATNKKVKLSSESETADMKNLVDLFMNTKKQVLILSGNLSFLNFKTKEFEMIKIIESLIKKGISIKVLCRVDIASKQNIEKLLALNFKYGKELIEIHHKEHPLRASIFDNQIFHIKEIKEPTGKSNELDKKTFIFYTIREKEWVEWLSKVFWKMFNSSVDVKKRIQELQKLRV